MKTFLNLFIMFLLTLFFTTFCQLIPNSTNYNQDIVRENVFTNGPGR